jgi:hypothetical protein
VSNSTAIRLAEAAIGAAAVAEEVETGAVHDRRVVGENELRRRSAAGLS